MADIIRSINPYDSKVLAEFHPLSESDVKSKILLSERAYSDWKGTSFEHRSKLLKNVSVILNRDQEKYARTISEEMGKILNESEAEVKKCADGCIYYAGHAKI